MSPHDPRHLTRRQWITTATAAGVVAAATPVDAKTPSRRDQSFRYCLNTSTIRGQNLDLPAQIDVIADAGYSAAELWVRDLENFVKRGGNLDDLAKRIRDRGLSVPSTIAFVSWMAEDAGKRAAALEQAKREMDLVRRIGGTRIAAPPAGVSDRVDLLDAARRYRALLDVGAAMGVVPQLELWGFSKTVSRLGEAACVAMESGHPQACLLLDVYHIYKGGSDFEALRFLNGEVLHVLHFNDYPATPPRAEINDAARVFPGDGVAPLKEIVRTLRAIDFDGFLSLEVFNRDYWKQDAHLVARTGLKKMKSAIATA
jgi:sugar phosphate isomerase/epimerase